MTTKQAKRLATAAGYECYYDRSIRLWAVYKMDNGQDPSTDPEARYFTADNISGMTEFSFYACYLGG